jgi:type 1 fimbria pilin
MIFYSFMQACFVRRARLACKMLVVSSILQGSTAFAVTTHGQVNISGNILSNSCAVSVGDINKTVNLGGVASKQFTGVGTSGGPYPFNITLEDCGPKASGVAITFSGVADSANNQLLATDNIAGAATGVAIGILDYASKALIPINTASPIYTLTPNQTSAVLHFYARYTAVADSVTAGTANATATFQMNYQ